MGTIVKFLAVLILLGVITVGTSFLWPRFTSQPRPAQLQQVYEVFRASKLGQPVAVVLGVSDEANTKPFDIGNIAKDTVDSAVASVQTYTASVVFLQVARQLAHQFEALSPEQQEEVRQMICVPQASTPALEAGPSP